MELLERAAAWAMMPLTHCTARFTNKHNYQQAPGRRWPSHSDAPYLSVIIVILIWKTAEQIRWTWNVKLYRNENVHHGRIIYGRSIKLIDSWLQPPAGSMDGTIDYLSLCNKTSGFIRGVCFILSIWMCKKKNPYERVHRKCVWCASDRAANCSQFSKKKLPRLVGICRWKQSSSDIINQTAYTPVHCRNLVLNITFFFRLFPLAVFKSYVDCAAS